MQSAQTRRKAMQSPVAGRRSALEHRRARPPEGPLRVAEPEWRSRTSGSPRAVPGRRTITITGQTVPGRPRRSRTVKRVSARPDRVALWAFMLAVFLVVVAAATAHAAPL